MTGDVQPAVGVTIETLLARAARYIDDFLGKFVDVVAEEQYVQRSTNSLPSFNPLSGGRGAPNAPSFVPVRHRELRSDFLLVRSPESADLLAFRDVLEVDGTPVRDHQQRIEDLFVQPWASVIEQADEIRRAGARYSLGNLQSTVNNPMLAMAFLQASYQERFRFTLGREDRNAGDGVWIVEYKERSKPTLIKGPNKMDLLAHGRVWIVAATGRIVKTELLIEQPRVQTRVTTSFRRDDRFGIDVPFEMRDDYELGRQFGGSVSIFGIAKYGRFRRFGVQADEVIKVPTQTLVEQTTGMTLVEIPAGRFTMGSPASEAGRNPDEAPHDVTIGRPFFLGRFEVTQQEWRTVMGTAPSHFRDCGPRCPVENISFDDAQQFVAKLNAQAPSDVRYRLPTEAEWEYACRAGTTTPFATGENVTTAQVNYNGKFPYASFAAGDFRERPTSVGTFGANEWELRDMHGNVWEWTSDWYGAYSAGPVNDPRGSSSGTKRVIRGGSWAFDANSTRCALRYTHAPQDRGFSLGFRLAADVTPAR